MANTIGTAVLEIRTDTGQLSTGLQSATVSIKGFGEQGDGALRKISAAFDEFIRKQTALGQAIPPGIAALNDQVKALQATRDAAASMADRLDASIASLKTFASSTKAIGKDLSVALTGPLVGGATLAIKSAMDFESAFAGVRKTVSGSPAELDAINSQFRELAKVTPVSAVGLAHIGEQAGQLGVAKENIVAFTKTIVDISVATHLTADEAGESFAKIANVMKMPQEQFSNLGSAVVALGNFGASTEQEMLSMAQRISAAGATAGMTAPQVLGIANALSSVGIEAEAGGTAVSKVINQISMYVANGSGKLDTFAKAAGMSAKDFAAAWRDDAGNAFAKFMQGLADARANGGEQLLQLIRELGLDTNVRLVNAFMSAANAGDLMRKSIALGTKAFDENTEVTRAAEERYKTFANQLKILENNVNDVAIEFGQALLPVARDAVQALVAMMPYVKGLVEEFEALPTPVKDAMIGTGAFLAVLGPGLFVLGSFAGALGDLAKAARVLSETEAMGTAVKGIGALKTAIAELNAVIAGSEFLTGALIAGGLGLSVGAFIAAASQLHDRAKTVADSLDGVDASTQKTAATLAGFGVEANKTGQLLAGAADGMKKPLLAIDALKDQGPGLVDSNAKLATSFHLVNGKLVEFSDAAKIVAAAHHTLAEQVAALTDAQKADIESKHEQHESIKAIATETGIAADVVRMYVAQNIEGVKHAKEFAEAVAKNVDALYGEKKSYDELFAAVRQIISLGPLEEDVAKRIVDALDTVHKAHGRIPADLEAWRQSSETIGTAYEKLTTEAAKHLTELQKKQDEVLNKDLGKAGQALLGNLKVQTAAIDAYNQAIGKSTLTSTQQQLAAVDKWERDEKATLDQRSANYREAEAAVVQAAQARRDEINRLNDLEDVKVRFEFVGPQVPVSVTFQHWKQDIGELSSAFSQLAQVAGDTWGGILQTIGKAIASLNVATTAVEQFKDAQERGDKAGQIGAGIGVATGVASLFSTVVQGVQAALKTPQWKAVMEQVGRDWGAAISQGLSESIAGSARDITAKVFPSAGIFHMALDFSVSAASMVHLGEIIKEAGGINADNLKDWVTRSLSLFDQYKRGLITIAQAQKSLDDVFPLFVDQINQTDGSATREMLDLIKLDQQLGLHSKAIAEFLKAQGASATTGVTNFLGVNTGAMDQADKIQKQMDALKSQNNDIFAKAGNRVLTPDESKQAADLDRQWQALKQQLDQVNGVIDATAIKSQEEASAIGAAVVGSFNLAIQSGMSFTDALKQSQPEIEALRAELDKTGLDGGAAFNMLAEQVDLLKDPIAGPVLNAVQSLAAGFKGLANTGTETKEEFQGFGVQVKQAFDSLVAQGKSGPQIMMAMQGPLQELWEEEQQYGFKLDDATQALLDQAVASGEVGEKHKSTTDQMLDAENKLVDIMAALAKAFGVDLPASVESGVNDAKGDLGDLKGTINGLPTHKDIDINVNTHHKDDGGGGFGQNFDGSTDFDGDPSTPMARGGFGRVSRAMLFTAGEAGPEDVVFGGAGRNLARDVAVELAGQFPQGSAGGDITITLNSNVDGQTVARSLNRVYLRGGDLVHETRELLGVR